MTTLVLVVYCPRCDYFLKTAVEGSAPGTHGCMTCRSPMEVYVPAGTDQIGQWHRRGSNGGAEDRELDELVGIIHAGHARGAHPTAFDTRDIEAAKAVIATGRWAADRGPHEHGPGRSAHSGWKGHGGLPVHRHDMSTGLVEFRPEP